MRKGGIWAISTGPFDFYGRLETTDRPGWWNDPFQATQRSVSFEPNRALATGAIWCQKNPNFVPFDAGTRRSHEDLAGVVAGIPLASLSGFLSHRFCNYSRLQVFLNPNSK